MELYHNNMSVCAQKVRLVLREKQLRPVEHHLNLRAGDATRPEYLKLNPNGVIPTLIDQGTPIIESTVICEYLEDSFPDFPLRPNNTVARARMRTWTLLPDSGLHHACGISTFAIAFRHQMLRLPKEELERQLAEKPSAQVRENLRQTIALGIEAPQFIGAIKVYGQAIDKMSHQLEQTAWLAGEQYSLADAALLPYVCRLETLAMTWMWDRKHPSITSWLDRCKARANFAGITDYLDKDYVSLMYERGRELRAPLQTLLG
jgi:glutathione S-transferase